MNKHTFEERVKKLISNLYAPATTSDYDIRMSTTEVYNDLCTILPEDAFDEFDLLNWLEDLQFEPQYQTKTYTRIDDDDKEVTEPFDDIRYYWYMKKIK